NLAPKAGGARRGETGEAAKTEPAKTEPTKTAPAQTGTAAKGSTTKASPTVGGSATELFAKPTDNLASMKVELDARRLKIYSAALDEMDKKNNAEAIKLFKQVLKDFPGFKPAERNLQKLGAA